ncbi:MAG: hypothetical protein OXC95_08825 [Dehalococcoidia bacterium]|nr:hypothetical protein [Dehalococcoidia bacterium]
MPYENEFATGESLWRLLENESVKRFQGEILVRAAPEPHEFPPSLTINRGIDSVSRIIAIDGSDVPHQVQNGFPKAEAALLNIAAVVIKTDALRAIGRDDIPSPSQLRELEQPKTMSAVLPGPNVVGKTHDQDTPTKYFRSTMRQELDFKLDPNHESLLETFLTITETARQSGAAFRCPIADCDKLLSRPDSDTICPCEKKEPIYPTDSLRIQERFYDNMSSRQAFTAFRQVTEHLLLVNILRYFYQNSNPAIFDDIAFIMDGPLAIFGMPAWVKQYIQDEIARIHSGLIEQGRPGLLVMGIEKTGEFLDHFQELDWLPYEGPRQRLGNGAILVPTTEYIYRYINPNPNTDKAYGEAVYYGRKLMYKSKVGQHSVVMIPMVNEEARRRNSVSQNVFPRLNDALNIIDSLYTHLYQDGFAPLVRANAHAAIPLRTGQRILENLFDQLDEN